jgi:hypothetical protein
MYVVCRFGDVDGWMEVPKKGSFEWLRGSSIVIWGRSFWFSGDR